MLSAFLFAFTCVSNGAVSKTTESLNLGETVVSVNIYENAGARITLFAPHFNEKIARRSALEFVAENGGRFIEIESVNEKGGASRNLNFKLSGRNYSVDPNRIFTENGRNCALSGEVNAAVKRFADSLLKLIFAPDTAALRNGENFVVAVHNNSDFTAQASAGKNLTAHAFIKTAGGESFSHGAYQEQAEGVYLSNEEDDADNFIFLSTAKYVSHFAERGFNIVIQKSPARLNTKKCTIDDGSLSVYSAQHSIEYICLEADARSGAARQKQMLDAVLALTDQEEPDQTKLTAKDH